MISGILWQVDRRDAGLSPAEQIARAIAHVGARHGWRPAAVHVHAGGEWPERVGETLVTPTRRMGYPGLMLLERAAPERGAA